MNFLGQVIFIFHEFNKFLGTLHGDLLKYATDFLLLLFSTYMIVSEYRNTKATSLFSLSIGFGVLAFQRLIATLLFMVFVFGSVESKSVFWMTTHGIRLLEISALVLLSFVFLLPSHKENYSLLRKRTLIHIVVVGVVSCAALAVPVMPLVYNWFTLVLIELVLLFTLLYPASVFLSSRSLDPYHTSISLAFMIYAITPFTNLVNLFLFFGTSSHLKVFAHPFPFLAVLLLTRVIFLKLVDKASLHQQLLEARRKYSEERALSGIKDNFISIVSHELRTPLTSMKLYLSLLRGGKFGMLQDKQLEAVTTMEHETNRLTTLINDMLDLSRLESKKVRIRRKQVLLLELVADTVYLNLAEEKDIEVRNLIPSHLVVFVDPDKFKQVIINLYSNAVKYTPNGGTITLSGEEDDEFIYLTITDTGIGISKEDLPRIFDKFYQVEHHMIRKQGGTGLGLAISKNIVELHKGFIKVRSKLGKGSTFVVGVPKQQVKAKAEES